MMLYVSLLKKVKGELVMEEQEKEKRITAIKTIIQAVKEGERINKKVDADMDKAGVSIPETPDDLFEEPYDRDTYEDYEDARWEYISSLEEHEDWNKLIDDSKQIWSKIIQDKYTLEEVGEYIQNNPGCAIDIDSVDLFECKPTENDLKYEGHLLDGNILEYFDEKDGPYLEPEDVAKMMLEKGIRLEDFPEQLLFNPSFISAYIQQIAFVLEKEAEQEGITPQDIEDASSGVGLEKFREATSQMKETGRQERGAEEKIND